MALVSLFEDAVLEEITLDLAGGESFVATDGDGIHLHLLLLIDVDFQDNLARMGDVVFLQNLDFRVLVALFVEVTACEQFGAVDEVRRHLIVLDEAELLLQILALALLHARILDLGDLGAHGEFDVQEGGVCHEAVNADGDIREESVFPVAAYGLGDFIARQGYALPLGKT